MKILDSKYLPPVGMKLGSEYTLTNNNVWKIATDSGLQEANQEEADYNQVILETNLKYKNYVLAEVSIDEVRFTHDKGVRGIINFTKGKDHLQVRV
jgi:hypothetical protein